jgi:hypothetical protein
MRKGLLAICTLLALVSASFAAAPSNASLNGKYTFQLSRYHNIHWTSTADPCGLGFFATGGGSDVADEIVYGVFSFDGKGNVSETFTQNHVFDASASSATVQFACVGGGASVVTTNGYPVFSGAGCSDFPITGCSASGTYAVQSDGTGAMTLTFTGTLSGVGLLFEVSGSNGKGIRNTILLHSNDKSDNPVGMAVLQ